jgi:hypothetical protein
MKRLALALLTVLIGVLVVGGSVLVFGTTQAEPALLAATVSGTAPTPQGELPHATLEMSVYPQSSAAEPGPTSGVNAVVDNQGWPFYAPSTSIRLPAHSLVTITVHQYDSMTPLYNDFFARVHGTVDGTALFNGKAGTSVDLNTVAHTFTIHSYGEATQPDLFVSVPMPGVANNAPNEANGYPKPNDITFSFITGDPGEYVWNCEDPCGDGYVEFGGPMSQRGFMSGTVTVA